MRFMMIVKANKAYEAGEPPNPKLMAAVAKLGEEQMKKGVLLMTGGLAPSSQGARVYVSGGTLEVKDGPFTRPRSWSAASRSCRPSRSPRRSSTAGAS
jgi:hypothetical protein